MKLFTICADCVIILNEKEMYIAPYADFVRHCEQLNIEPVGPLAAGYKTLTISDSFGRESCLEDFNGNKLPVKDLFKNINEYIHIINNADWFNAARENKLEISRPATPAFRDSTDRIA